MSARLRPPRRLATLAAYSAVYAVFAGTFCVSWGLAVLLWQGVRLAVAYPDLAVLSAAALVVGYATHQRWRQARGKDVQRGVANA